MFETIHLKKKKKRNLPYLTKIEEFKKLITTYKDLLSLSRVASSGSSVGTIMISGRSMGEFKINPIKYHFSYCLSYLHGHF